jgi:hypothetical protein
MWTLMSLPTIGLSENRKGLRIEKGDLCCLGD